MTELEFMEKEISFFLGSPERRLMIDGCRYFKGEQDILRKQRTAIGEDGKRHSTKTGHAVGRPALVYPQNWDDVYADWKAGKITAKAAMEQTGLKRTSFYKLVKLVDMKENG